MNLEIFGISIYVLLMLVMGIYVSKRIKTDDDYFLAGRSLGPVLATFSIFATWFGAETCIGTAGAVYRHGLASIHADPLGYCLCIFLMGFFFAKILWRKKITTIPDLFRERFGVQTERMAAFIMIPSSIIWAGAQIRAFGQIIHSTTELNVATATTVAALVVIGYTTFGGLLADAYSDLIQGIALIAGLAFLLISVVMDMGGIAPALSSIDFSRTSLFGFDGNNVSTMGRIELWMVPILGSLMAQELVSRVVASRSQNVAYNSCLRAGVIYLIVGSIPVLIGLLGPNYMPSLTESETIMPLLAKMHLNTFFYVLFVGALVAAILSTVDSTLLAASALGTHNLVFPMMKQLTEKKKVILARAGVILSGIMAYVIAFSSESITELVETASSLGGPSILVITIIALYVKKGTGINATAAIVMSIVSWAFCNFLVEMEFPIIMTVAVCALTYFGTLPLVKGQETGSIAASVAPRS
jgi:SSS family solute:Na+ symporter